MKNTRYIYIYCLKLGIKHHSTCNCLNRHSGKPFRHKDDSKILNSDDRGDQTVKNPSTECEDEDGLEMSDADLKETTVEMLFAGYMTTASIATSAIINLISHPEVFRKLENELRHFGFLKDQNSSSDSNSHDDVTLAPIKRVVAGNGHVPLTRHRRGDPDLFNNNSQKCFLKQKYFEENVLTVDMLSKLAYLEQFFKETLRIMPPILGGYRLALKTFQLGVSVKFFLDCLSILDHANIDLKSRR